MVIMLNEDHACTKHFACNRLLGKKKQYEITSHLSTIAGNAAKSKGSLMSKKQLPALDSIMHYTANIGAATDV